MTDTSASASVAAASDDEAYRTHRQALFDAGLLVPTGVDGVYGRSGTFESIVAAIDGLASAASAQRAASVWRFPPVAARTSYLKTDHLRSFPDLTGDVCSFYGDDSQHREVLGRLDQDEPYGDLLGQSEVVLCPAVCHPLYGTLPSGVESEGAYYDVSGWVFRHEPSVDPARLMSFRQHDIVYVGTPEGAAAHRDRTLAEAVELYARLGLEVETTVANDPFFGRAGRILAVNQRDEELKYEILARTSGAERLTAIASANCHEDHFGHAFGLHLPGGEPAHSACFGYGLERTTLALIWAHGTDPGSWPAGVRSALWP